MLQPPQIFTVRGFEALFPHSGTLSYSVCLTPQLFLLVYPYANLGLPGPPAATSPSPPVTALPTYGPLATDLPQVLSALAAGLRPSYQSR